jgi:hypothetical protein
MSQLPDRLTLSQTGYSSFPVPPQSLSIGEGTQNRDSAQFSEQRDRRLVLLLLGQSFGRRRLVEDEAGHGNVAPAQGLDRQ